MRGRRPHIFGGTAVGGLILAGIVGCTPDQFFAESVLVSHPTPLVRLPDPPQRARLSFFAEDQVVPASHADDPDKPAEPELLPGPKEQTETLPKPGEATESTGRGITLDQAISTTLLADPRIRAGLEAINQSKGDALTASLKPNPTILVDALMLPLRRYSPTNTLGPPQQDAWVGYPIDWFLFGKRAAAMASAALGVRASEADYADLVRTRVTDTAVAYFDVLEAKALVDLARQDVKNYEDVAERFRKAVEVGGRPRLELNRILLSLLASRQILLDAQSSLAAAKARLRALLGRTDSDPAFDVAGSLDVPLTAEPLPADEAFKLAVENRPDVQSLRLKVAQADAEVKVQHTRAFPELTPSFGYTHQYQRQALGQPDADSWNVQVTTALPLFDRNQGNRAKAESVAAQSRHNLQAGLVDLRAELETVINSLRTAKASADAVAGDQLRLAREVRDAINQAVLAAGGRSVLEVLDAERNYRETVRLYITSRANYWRSLYRFNSAIGKQVLR